MPRVGSTPSPKRLIINADDFGIAPGVNVGIIEAAEAGAVTSASMIVNLPGFADALDRAVSSPALSLGLHLNFTVGRPLSAVSSLTQRESGEFYPLATLLTRASLGLLDAADVTRECEAQIDRMAGAGFPPTHLDSHRHVHAHPAIFPIVGRAAASLGIFQIRVPCEPLQLNAGDWLATLKKVGFLLCARMSYRVDALADAIGFVGVSLQGGESFH